MFETKPSDDACQMWTVQERVYGVDWWHHWWRHTTLWRHIRNVTILKVVMYPDQLSVWTL